MTDKITLRERAALAQQRRQNAVTPPTRICAASMPHHDYVTTTAWAMARPCNCSAQALSARMRYPAGGLGREHNHQNPTHPHPHSHPHSGDAGLHGHA